MTILLIVAMITFREKKNNRISMEMTSSIEILTPASVHVQQFAQTKPDNNSDWDQYMNNIPGSARKFLYPQNLVREEQIAPSDKNQRYTQITVDGTSPDTELELADRSRSVFQRKMGTRFCNSFIQSSSQRFGSPINSPRTPVVCSTKLVSKFKIRPDCKNSQPEEISSDLIENIGSISSEISIKTGPNKPVSKKERRRQTLSQIIYVYIYIYI